MPRRMYSIIASLLVLSTACDSLESSRTSDTTREARDFMEEYAEELRSHDRQAVANRYHPSGAFIIFDGNKRLSSFEEIETRYKESWTGPTTFRWRDLTYEVLGPDAVVVIGQFDWGNASDILTYSYTGLLRRSDGKLHIRLEVETEIDSPEN